MRESDAAANGPVHRLSLHRPFNWSVVRRMPITTKLILSFLLVIVVISTIFTVAGVQLIANRIVAEAQEKVRYDLNAAHEIYQSRLGSINDVIRFTADRTLLMNALRSGDVKLASDELVRVKEREKLDILTITDPAGRVLLRTSHLELSGDSESANDLVSQVLTKHEPVAATTIISTAELQKESPLLADQAYFRFIATPKARPRSETEETAGMMLMAAAPIFDFQQNLIGIVYGGTLLNRNYELVDKIKQTVFQDLKYDGKDIGTATIFQDDVRISTNVKNEDGSRAIGTRLAEDVYNQIYVRREPWIGRAYVVNNWYITAYEPIDDINNQVIGSLYVGILEQKYLDLQRETAIVFLAISFVGALGALALSYLVAQRISGSIHKLAWASREIAHGDLDARVEIRSNDELQELADAFNYMTAALKARDRQLKEFATQKIMESERLAMIGQLAANVAHELNNPLQGIVTFSHLLLERMPEGNGTRSLVQKIVVQSDRCTAIIRGLLDFSRQSKPLKQPSNVNQLLQDCISLVQDQATFHNIRIVRQYAENLPPAMVDPAQMQQVLMNLIINAAEAMGGSGTLTLGTRRASVAGLVEVTVADTGRGIPQQDLERIFDPFFTTKEVGHGTGLGLAISYGIIKEHKGTISVESQVGKGTTFTVRLPTATEEKATANGERIPALVH